MENATPPNINVGFPPLQNSDDGAFFLYHKCGIKAHYIGYVNSDAKPNV